MAQYGDFRRTRCSSPFNIVLCILLSGGLRYRFQYWEPPDSLFNMKNDLKKVIALFDVHIPNNIDLSGILKFLNDEKPDILILGGDFMDVESLSHWAMAGGKRLTLEGKRWKEECRIAGEMLDKFREIVGKKCEIVYLMGNHEEWPSQYIDRNPEMSGIIDIQLMLELDKRNIKWIPYKCEKNFYKVGKLYFTHGEYTVNNHSLKMLRSYNCNIRYGHLHTYQAVTKTSKKDIGDMHTAISVPCLCKPGEYLGGKCTSHINGFYVAYIKPDGNFFEYVIMIINNHFFFNNKLY